MKVLMVAGDRRIFEPDTEPGRRFALQRSTVEVLEAVYWGRGSFWPRLPEGSFDVVTVQDPFWRGVFGWFSARQKGARLNVQVHTDFAQQGAVKRFVGAFVLRRADSVRVVSEAVKRSLAPLRLRCRIDMLPVFIDLAAVERAPVADLEVSYPQFTHALLVAARLEPEKNVAATVRMMPEVLKALPGAGLFIAGSGSERPALELLAKNLSIEDHVIFLGHRADIFSLYKGVDVLVQLSRFEGYGASVVEALAAGCPVVSTDAGIAREAGAAVAPEGELARTVIAVLQSGTRGVLKLPVLSREAWAARWKETLI